MNILGLFSNAMTAVCILFACQALLVSSVSIRKRRNSLENIPDENERQSMKHGVRKTDQTTHQSCVSVLQICKRNTNCRETLKDLKIKCAVRQGSCNADMRDLPACANIMDRISQYFVFDKKCLCAQSSRCSRIHTTIYDNPCFASVKFLREKNMMPQAGKSSNEDLGNINDMTSSNDFIQELIESATLKRDDVNFAQEELTTLQPELNNNGQELYPVEKENSNVFPDELEIHPELNSEFKPSPSPGRPKPSHQNQKNSNKNSVILYIIVGVVGILLVVLLVFGLGLLLYCGFWKKGRNTTKNATTTK